MALVVKNLLPMQETEEPWVPSLSWEEPLEEAMAAHSCSCLEKSKDRGA